MEDLAKWKENGVTTNDPRARDGSDELSKESKEAANWIAAGFKAYADIVGRKGQRWAALADADRRKFALVWAPPFQPDPFWAAPAQPGPYGGEIHETVRIQIERYGEEFGPILLDDKVEMSYEDDLLALRRDLYGLMTAKRTCSAVVLVELMLAGTSDYGVTIPDLLFRAPYLRDYLEHIKNPPPPAKLSMFILIRIASRSRNPRNSMTLRLCPPPAGFRYAHTATPAPFHSPFSTCLTVRPITQIQTLMG